MKRFSLAIVATAGLLLAGCGGGNEDSINEAEVNAAQVDALNELSMDAANDASNMSELETLGNQAAELEQEAPANLSADTNTVDPVTADDEAMNVSGM